MKLLDNKLIMPKGIRYISESDYTLEDFQFPHILDKKIPGCGYTEYCITSNLPTILCSPRRILLENKEAQHRDEVLYFKNELDKDLGMDKDITKQLKDANIILNEEVRTKTVLENNMQHLRTKLDNYINFCLVKNKVPKILVTYDSFRLVKEILIEKKLLDRFYIVIDEMQSVFCDSRFKSSTEMEFINQLQGLNKVCFVSATPMIDKYLKMVDEFKGLPYFEIDWSSEDPLRTIKPDLKVRVTQSITGSAIKIIEDYKKQVFESSIIIDELGNRDLIVSTEAVIYVNSVNNIISIIKKAELQPDECNILCADTEYNARRIKNKLGRKFEIGKVPLKGELHKMFTFCTRTVYLGADFYSTCARTFILSDANIDTLAVDISLDLPQILGRQRLLENPWKNRAEFYYKTLGKANELTEEEFNKLIKFKIKKTNDLLISYENTPEDSRFTLAEKYIKDIRSSNYKDDYIAVNEHSGSTLVPCLNNLVLIAEQRAFDIQQIDYKDRFTVFNTMVSNGLIESTVSDNVSKFLNYFNNVLEDFSIKLKALCEVDLSDKELCVILDQIPLTYKNYYLVLGPDRCKARGYNKTRVELEYQDLIRDKVDIEELIYNIFKIGNKYSNSDAKSKLKDIYSQTNYNKMAKATDLENYFNIRSCRININGKWDHGIEIISKK